MYAAAAQAWGPSKKTSVAPRPRPKPAASPAPAAGDSVAIIPPAPGRKEAEKEQTVKPFG